MADYPLRKIVARQSIAGGLADGRPGEWLRCEHGHWIAAPLGHVDEVPCRECARALCA